MNTIARILLIAVLQLVMAGHSAAQDYSKHTTDSLVDQLPQLEPDSEKVHVLYNISYGYQNIDPAKGIEYGNRAIALAGSLGYKSGLATANAMVGLNYAAQSEYPKALEFETKAIEFYRAVGNKKSEAAMLSNISLIYSNQSNYAKALDYAYQALKVYEDMDLELNQAYLLDNIGILYFRQEKHEKALDHYRRSGEIYEAQGNKSGLARSRGNAGMIYHELGSDDKALELHREALAINKELGLKSSVQTNLRNIGNALMGKEDYTGALEQYKRALSINEELGNKGDIATTLGNIGTMYLEVSKAKSPDGQFTFHPNTSNLEVAIDFLSKAVEQCRELGMYDPMARFTKLMSEAYHLLGENGKAYETYLKYDEFHDSLNSAEVQQKVAGLEMSRELEVKDKNLRLKEKEVQIQKLELQKSRFIFGLYSLLVALAIVVIIVLWKKYRRHKARGRLLLEKNERYLRQINGQLDDLKKHSTVLSEIAYMQAHDVRGPVSSLLAFVNMFNRKNPRDPVNEFIMDNMGRVVKKLDEAVKAVVQKENELKQ